MQGGGSTARGNVTTSQQTEANGKRGAGSRALIGRDCGRGRVKGPRGGGINTATCRQMRDNYGGGKGEGGGNDNGKCLVAAI